MPPAKAGSAQRRLIQVSSRRAVAAAPAGVAAPEAAQRCAGRSRLRDRCSSRAAGRSRPGSTATAARQGTADLRRRRRRPARGCTAKLIASHGHEIKHSEALRFNPLVPTAMVRFGRWDEVLAHAQALEDQLFEATMSHYTRGLAFAAKPDVKISSSRYGISVDRQANASAG